MNIRSKLVVTFVGFAMLIMVSASFLMFIYSKQVLVERQVKRNVVRFTTLQNQIELILTGFHGEAFLFNDLDPIPTLLQKKEGPLTPEFKSLFTKKQRQLASDFIRLLKGNPYIDEVSLMNVEGQEIVRVFQMGSKSNVIPDKALKNRKDEPYFKETLKLEMDALYFSSLAMKKEGGQTPVIRIGVPLYSPTQQKWGVIILSVKMSHILELIGKAPYGQILMIDQDGKFLLHPNRAKQFSLEENYFLEQPEMKSLVKESYMDMFRDREDNEYRIWQRIYYDVFDKSKYWVVFSVIQESDLFKPIYRLMRLGLMVGMLALLVVILIAFIFARNLSKPILALHQGINHISKGNLEHRVATDEKDEIGELSRAFDHMVENLNRVTASRDELNREVHERKRAEEELVTQAEELKRSNKELEQFAYVASHDLQEPLRKITAFSGLIMEEDLTGVNDDVKGYLERMQASAKRMSRLIDDLLKYSRVTLKGEAFREVNLNLVMEEVLADLEMLIQETKAELIVDRNLPTVYADETQMRQLMQNLVGNSLKYCKKEAPPHIIVKGVSEGEDQIGYCVEDTGIGFDQKFVEKIFMPFQRLHTKNEFEGTGIGLAICQKIAQRHGGRIEVQSKLGEGSSFTVYLPKGQKGVML